MREIRHRSLKEQAEAINQILRGHYAYYGLAGNFWSLRKVYRRVARYWLQDAVQPELERAFYVGGV
jgi:hypothetical protein